MNISCSATNSSIARKTNRPARNSQIRRGSPATRFAFHTIQKSTAFIRNKQVENSVGMFHSESGKKRSYIRRTSTFWGPMVYTIKILIKWTPNKKIVIAHNHKAVFRGYKITVARCSINRSLYRLISGAPFLSSAARRYYIVLCTAIKFKKLGLILLIFVIWNLEFNNFGCLEFFRSWRRLHLNIQRFSRLVSHITRLILNASKL